ncbi:MAG: glycosyltransferase family 2 protein, partial [Bacteroidota bacterium]
MNPDPRSISLIIPIFNEEEVLPQLLARLWAVADQWNRPYEIILVDDGSTDASVSLIRTLAKGRPEVKLLHLSRNFGHQAAISAGLQIALGAAVILLDGDLQDPPEVLEEFIAKWEEGYEVVYAIRTKRKEGPFKRLMYKGFYRILRRISDLDIPLDSGDFCLMDHKVVEVLRKELPESIRFVRGLRTFAGFRQIGLKVERDPRAAGQPK